MWGFPWMFWMVALLFYMVATRRHRRWRRWAMRGAAWYPPPWALHSAPWSDPRLARERQALAVREADEQRHTIDALESRIAELEERLDFTEHLLAGRKAAPPSGG